MASFCEACTVRFVIHRVTCDNFFLNTTTRVIWVVDPPTLAPRKITVVIFLIISDATSLPPSTDITP